MSMIKKWIQQTFPGMVKPPSAKIAKDRLSIMLVHQRNNDVLANIDIDALQKEVALVVQKYIKGAQKPSQVSVKQEGDFDFLEMHFPLEGRK